MLKELLSPWGWTEARLHVNVKWLFNLVVFRKVLCLNNIFILVVCFMNAQRKQGGTIMFALF